MLTIHHIRHDSLACSASYWVIEQRNQHQIFTIHYPIQQNDPSLPTMYTESVVSPVCILAVFVSSTASRKLNRAKSIVRAAPHLIPLRFISSYVVVLV